LAAWQAAKTKFDDFKAEEARKMAEEARKEAARKMAEEARKEAARKEAARPNIVEARATAKARGLIGKNPPPGGLQDPLPDHIDK
jgi:hypothetical protein